MRNKLKVASFFSITRTGPYRITVTNANGCRATVGSRIDTLL